MKALPIQRETLVALLKDILKEDPAILQEALAQLKTEGEGNDRARKVAALIEADFNRFEDVFKALA